MCGIFGQLSRRGADQALVERMAHCLDHRGPDGFGTYHNGTLAFGAGRLAIIDPGAPAGPLFSEDRRVAVVFNGEIYNYRTLRAELERGGHVFATRTDTEVIVHGYESWGRDVLSRLRGMFALGIWDGESLLLARDRLGEKPLYYTCLTGENTGDFLFASEIKALFEHPGVPRCVNHDALPAYLTLGYTPPPLTMFGGIYKLAPGEWLHICADGAPPKVERYWQPTTDKLTPRDLSYREAVAQVRTGLQEAVEMRLMSDVPLGAFLSGGLDSTAVVALMGRATGKPVQTFTVGFDSEAGSKADTKFNVDARYAALAAERLGTAHHTIALRQDDRLAWLLPHLIAAMDEPVAQPAMIQTVHITALARQRGVPVLLSGDAGDELFAGYPAYRADRVLERYLRLPDLLRRGLLTPILEHLPSENAHTLASKSQHPDPVERYLSWMKLIESERLPELLAGKALAADALPRLRALLLPLLAAPETRQFADRIAYTSLRLWLAEDSNMRVDKMSMAVSVESRAPMEDHEFVNRALALPLTYKLRGGDFKRVLKDAVADLVPPEILKRPKWGFFPPASEWLRTLFRPLVERYLSPEYVTAAGVFDPAAVTRLVEAHIVRREYQLWPLWSLLTFHLWHALYISGDLRLDRKLRASDLA